VKISVEVAGDLEPLGEAHHEPVFGGKRFRVSLAAFASGDRFVMVHAEQLADGGGTLDYSSLEPDALGAFAFTARQQCADLPAEVVTAEHDLRFLRDSGFDPSPGVVIRQYLTTSKDGNSELVLTYGERVKACGAATSGSLADRAKAAFRVLRLER
jgi:hypothetical protein